MAKTLVIDKYWKSIEINLNDPDPLLRTHCAICLRPLFPTWQNKNGTREIADKAIAAICWKCSSYGPDKQLKIPTVDQMKEARQAELRMKAKERRRTYIPKKKRDKAVKRGEAMNKRPCGCSIKGRHKSTCKYAKNYKAKGSKNDE